MRLYANAKLAVTVAVLMGGVGIVFLIEQGRKRDGVEGHAVMPVAARSSTSADSDLNQLLASLSPGQTTAHIAASLARMKAALLAMPPDEAAAWISARLKEGKDVTTGLEFSLASDQNLKEWPSLRVFLLDVLYLVDPVAAAGAGREILTTPTSADEWALAMRNVARGSSAAEDAALLKKKCEELLHHAGWREHPSAGYLEAFDVIVHTRNVALSPQLLALTADNDQMAVRHAAFLTLDRLVLADPVQMLPALLAAAPPDSGLMISNMIARADVRDSAQRQALESWLRDEHRTAAELEAFAGVFPNANMMVSHNLLTPVVTMQGTDRAAKDRAALEVVNSWLNDPAFSRSRELLRGTQARLTEFVK